MTAYVVENYRSHTPPDFRNLVGSESDPQSVVGVALASGRALPIGFVALLAKRFCEPSADPPLASPRAHSRHRLAEQL